MVGRDLLRSDDGPPLPRGEGGLGPCGVDGPPARAGDRSSFVALVALAESVRQLQGGWVLTYDDTPLIRQLYDGCSFVRRERRAGIGNNHGSPLRTIAEVIITPAGQPMADAD